MKELLILPALAVLMMGFASQLTDTAEQTTEKVALYTEEMNKAMDCAFLGKPLAECSPTLLETDFTEDLEVTTQQIKDLQAELLTLQAELEQAQAQAEAEAQAQAELEAAAN